MKKKLFLRKETVALLEGEQRGILGGERYSMACVTHNNVPPDCPMTSWCVETDFCVLTRRGDTCISIDICKFSDDLKCVASDNCIASQICVKTELCIEPVG